MSKFVEIPLEKIYTELWKTLEKRLPQTAMIVNLLHLHKNKAILPSSAKVKFYCFNGKLLENIDNCFILVISTIQPTSEQCVFVSTPETITKEMLLAFEEIIDWSTAINFGGICLDFSIELRDMIQRRASVPIASKCFEYTIPKLSEAMQIQIDDAKFPECVVKDISLKDAEKVDLLWKARSTSSLLLLQSSMENIGSTGIYKNEELVSGAVILFIGSINALFTIPQYANQGYGLLTMKSISKKCAEKGLLPITHVAEDNIASKKLMEKAGYKSTRKIYWIFHTPK